jgi:hypothetical protein
VAQGRSGGFLPCCCVCLRAAMRIDLEADWALGGLWSWDRVGGGCQCLVVVRQVRKVRRVERRQKRPGMKVQDVEEATAGNGTGAGTGMGEERAVPLTASGVDLRGFVLEDTGGMGERGGQQRGAEEGEASK